MGGWGCGQLEEGTLRDLDSSNVEVSRAMPAAQILLSVQVRTKATMGWSDCAPQSEELQIHTEAVPLPALIGGWPGV